MYYPKIKDASLERVIESLCYDYRRRKTAIDDELLPKRVLTEYKFLNSKILEGVIEIIGPADSEVLIDDIGMRRGYANSTVNRFSEVKYKQLKADIKLNIAKKLYLI
jgi:hypothetical protein